TAQRPVDPASGGGELMESLPKTLDRIYELLGVAQTGTAKAGSAPPGSPAASTEPWAALERLTTLFGLTPFERDVLALLSGHTLESRFADTPTFALALATLEDPHWSALSSA